ncbi:SusC/RagA family TonB-linked outer membrane protein [Pedobacter heparinus]|uniref:TonB-dependent receptor plug n=1 Tax=Pedobacter heparinus (strain ATCC 13125 / DSM 2366 / CIP 104194 / JCM 7457 / NBRC 12017 / NCIMB 9290 / NRRL B-14731 / HIM 762-3) TaxID=485917 RepID=C6XSH0_PEDHD|nr:TonB-dependent receptor [Pedobacter heparinus]ACU03515.1 TonB-dependent receptor plug [Pedobacter heparinus DSM 2366]
MKKIIQMIILLNCCLLSFIATAQTTIRGTVKDNAGGLPGVSIQEKNGKGNGTSTNETGEFRITLKGNSNILEVTAIGYLKQEVNVAGKTTVNITLKEDTKGLEEVVVIGFGTAKKITNTGAISTISAADVRTTPTPNIQNTLAGRAPGFISQQRSGQPGKTGADFYIRGVNSLSGESQKPLIIVDDVEYTYDQVAQLDVNEIETFTILKDASTTSVYGIKGANGVLVITTRRGKIGKPKVFFNTESGLQSAVHKPNFLDAYTVASLKNEAIRNDDNGTPPEFTDADLEHWRLKDDPYGHPDVDWYNAVFRNNAYQVRNTVDISGGSEKIKYFVSAGQVFQNGALRNFSKGTYEAPDNNYAYQRYTFRSNLDMQATKDLALRLDVTGRTGTITEPHIATSPLSTVYSFQRLPPYAEPLLNPDGSYPWAFRSRSSFYETSLIGRLALQGYDKTYRNEFNVLVSADHKLDFITQGLSVQARIAYSGDVSYDRKLYRNNIPAFYYNPVNNTYTIHSNNLYRLEPLTLESSAENAITRKTLNTLAKINYNRSFGNHNIGGLVLYNINDVTKGSYNTDTNVKLLQEYAPVSSNGFSYRASYDYKQRYLVDFSGAYNGTSQFVGKKTKGFFPAVSAGWNIAEEPFMKNNFKFIDLLKLRGSWGMTGSDITKGNNYKTEQIYGTGPNYNFGESSNTFTSIQEGSLGNLDITWEKSKKTDIGLDAQFFGGKLSLTADYFYDYRYDQLYIKEDVLKIIGVDLPYTNSAITENKGFDGQLGFRHKTGNLNYSASFTFSRARNKVVYQGEAAPRYAYLAKTGLPIGQGFGYNALGFFQTQEEVDNYAHVANAKPGDIKYEDANNDGLIDQEDYRAIGKPNLPQTVLGTALGVEYKGFSLNVFFQGSFDYSYRIATAGVIPFQGNLQKSALGRWTPETAATATFPRLSNDLAGPSSPSNASSFWMVDAHYIRLKSVDIGYMLPKQWTSKVKISSARIYVSGYDLYTWANFDLYSQDPEIASGGSAGTYPVQKVINLGLQVGF